MRQNDQWDFTREAPVSHLEAGIEHREGICALPTQDIHAVLPALPGLCTMPTSGPEWTSSPHRRVTGHEVGDCEPADHTRARRSQVGKRKPLRELPRSWDTARSIALVATCALLFLFYLVVRPRTVVSVLEFVGLR